MQLKEEVIDLVKKNQKLKLKLMMHFERSQYTLDTWLNTNNSNLLTLPALKIIAKEFGYDNIDELVEDSSLVITLP